MKKLKYVLCCFAALTIGMAFTGCSEESSEKETEVIYYDDSSNVYEDPGKIDEIAKENAQTHQGNINEKISVDVCDITVSKGIYLGERPKDALHPYDADLLALKVEFTNNSDEELSVSSLGDFKILLDDADTDVSASLTAGSMAVKTIDDYVSFDFDGIASGETVSGYLTFEAEVGWEEIHIEYTPLSRNHNYDTVVYTVTQDMIEK